MVEPREARVTLPHLRAWRLYRLLSQRDLAAKSDVGASTIIRIEAGGRANSLTVHRLARGLGVSADELLQAPPQRAQNGARE